MGKAEFAKFLRQLLRYYSNKQLLVIHDRAEQHKGETIATVVQEADRRLVLQPQPISIRPN